VAERERVKQKTWGKEERVERLRKELKGLGPIVPGLTLSRSGAGKKRKANQTGS